MPDEDQRLRAADAKTLAWLAGDSSGRFSEGDKAVMRRCADAIATAIQSEREATARAVRETAEAAANHLEDIAAGLQRGAAITVRDWISPDNSAEDNRANARDAR